MSAYRRAACIAVALLLPGTVAAAEHDEKGWFRYGSDEFEIVGVNRASEHEEFAMLYQVYLDTFDSYFAREGWPKPFARIISMPSRGAFVEVMGEAPRDSGMLSLGGFLEIDGEGGTVLNFSRIYPDSRIGATVYLELDWRLRKYGWYLPPWVSQGVGAVFAFAEFRHRGALDVGNLPFDLRRWNESHLLDWDRFFSAGHPDLAEMSARERGQYWAQSWGLVRWAVFSHEDPAARMRALAELTDRGATAAELLQFFGVGNPEELSAAVLRYAGERDYERFRFDPAVVDSRMHYEAMSGAESDALLADLMLASGDTAGASERLDAALARADRPLPLALLLAEARRCLLTDRRDEAVAHYREAIERGSDSPFALLVSAEDRVVTLEESADQLSPERRHQELLAAEREARRAIALEPSNGRAYNVLGRVAMMQDEVGEDLVRLMQQRIGADLWGARVRGYLGILLAKGGHRPEAVEHLAVSARNPELDEVERRAMEQRLAAVQAYMKGDREQVFASAMEAINGLLSEGRIDDAMAMAERLRARTADPDLRGQFSMLALEIDANVTRQKVAALIQRGRLETAESLATEFLDRAPADVAFRAEIEQLRALARDR